MHNPLVHYLIEQIATVQRQNKLIMEAFFEFFEEFEQDIAQLEEAMQQPEETQPRRLIFQGKEISQADFEAILEYTAKTHLESMTSFGRQTIKNKQTLENCETQQQRNRK